MDGCHLHLHDASLHSVNRFCTTASALQVRVAAIEQCASNVRVLFSWHDGPLVQAMKEGSFFLMDEISLAGKCCRSLPITLSRQWHLLIHGQGYMAWSRSDPTITFLSFLLYSACRGCRLGENQQCTRAGPSIGLGREGEPRNVSPAVGEWIALGW